MEAQQQGHEHAPPTISGELETPILRDVVLVAFAANAQTAANLLLRGAPVGQTEAYSLDAVAVDAAGLRIVARLAARPVASTQQESHDAVVEMDIGRPPSGTYVVELHVRRDGGLHRLQQSFVITVHNQQRHKHMPFGVGQDAD